MPIVVNVPYSDWYSEAPTPPAGDYAPYPLEIIQPQPGLDVTNRFYKQYTGLEYNVKVVVFGGDFSKLTYSLDNAPDGASINSSTGVISWPSATEVGSPHAFAVTVTAGEESASVAWTVTVNTNDTLFVDSAALTSGVGTIDDPMKLWTDFYGPTEGDDTYRDHQVYFRAGTHEVDGNAITGIGYNQWGNQKPLVFLAYDGESVTQDFNKCCIWYDGAGSNTYFDGFTWINVGNQASDYTEGCWGVRTNGSNITFRRNNMSTINNVLGSNNQAYVMLTAGGTHNYLSMTENTVNGQYAQCYAPVVTYNCYKAVVESNYIYNVGNIGIGWKVDNSYCASRGNWIVGGTDSRLVWLHYGSALGGEIETSWNYLETPNFTAEPYSVNDGYGEPTLGAHFIRNTVIKAAFYRRLEPGMATFYEKDNVFVTTVANNYRSDINNAPELVVQEGNLVNADEAGFLSTTTGLLIDTYSGQNATKGQNGLAGLK